MLNPGQEKLLAEKLADLANIAIGSLVFGVVVRAEAFGIPTLIFGIAIAVAAYAYSIALGR